MPDILLIGTDAAATTIETRLHAWGLAPERCAAVEEAPGCAAVQGRDMVILLEPDRRTAAWAADWLASGLAGPVLLWIGAEPPPETLRGPDVRWLAQTGDGPALRREILDALRHRERRRREILGGFREYVHFLDHELRTPLTSALNALRILQERLDGRLGRPERDFIQMAQRNLERLRRTVDWSGDYLAGRLRAVQPRWRELTAGELVSHALAGCGEDGRDVALEIAGGTDRKVVQADPELTATVLRQMLRALRYQAPGAAVGLLASLRAAEAAGGSRSGNGGRPGAGQRLVLQVRPAAGAGPVRRTGLAGRPDSAEAELGRLLEFAVSGELVARLQGTARACWDASGPALELALPLRPRTEATLEDSAWTAAPADASFP